MFSPPSRTELSLADMHRRRPPRQPGVPARKCHQIVRACPFDPDSQRRFVAQNRDRLRRNQPRQVESGAFAEITDGADIVCRDQRIGRVVSRIQRAVATISVSMIATSWA